MSTYSILKSNLAVLAITTDIYVTQAPQNATAPYIVLDFVAQTPQNTIACDPDTDYKRVGIDCIADTQSESINLYEACRVALEKDGYIQFIPIYGELDSTTQLYRTLFDYTVFELR